jgi:hypothetical protein
MINQATRQGYEGIKARLLKAVVDAGKFRITEKEAYVPEDFQNRMSDILGSLGNNAVLHDVEIAKLVSQAGVTPKIDTKKVDYLINTGESGKDFGRLSESQKARFIKFSNPDKPPQRGSGSSSGNRNQDRISNINRLSQNRLDPIQEAL